MQFRLLLPLYILSALISDDVIGHQVVNERRFLQAAVPQKSCVVNFEYLNYSIIKSECKAPEYPQGPCCDAFKKFACPFVDLINDSTTNCASKMVDALETLGNFPTDLFVRRCHEGKDGITCPAAPPSPSQPLEEDQEDAAAVAPPPIFMLQLLFLFLFLFLFLLETN